jgi:methanogenic corrinoid protein MtbC1
MGRVPIETELRDRFVAAQLGDDPRAALRIVTEECIRAGLSEAEILVEVVQAAQYEIGRRWREARVSVGEEHVGTAIAQLAVAVLQSPVEPRCDESVLIACVEGERHDLGARIVANLLELEGRKVCYAGADVPTESLIHLVSLRRPGIVGLSVTLPVYLAAARDAVRRLRDTFGATIAIAIGGQSARLASALPDGEARVITSDGKLAVAELVGLSRAHPSGTLEV